MKTFFSILALTASVAAFAQNISDYRYVRFPASFSDFNENKYGLKDRLKTALQKKNFTVLEAGAEAPSDECSILTADLKNASSMFRNKLEVVLKDCKNTTVATYKGMSMEKDFELGYREALTEVTDQFPISQPRTTVGSNVSTKTAEPTKKTEPVQAKQPEKAAENTVSSPSAVSAAEIYIGSNLSLHKVTMSSNQFILVNPNNSTPFAVFNQSGKRDVYHVKLQDGGFALGYTENGKIIVETPNADGNFTKLEFQKK